MATPYIVSGTARKGPREGYVEITSTINTDNPGETINLFIDAGTELATSQTITVRNIATGEDLTATTDSNGQYSIDLASLSIAYSNGDALRIRTDTISATRSYGFDGTTDSTMANKPTANRVYPVLAGRLGKEFTEVYPSPVLITNLQLNSENPSGTYAYTSGLLTKETIIIKGVQYSKTYTYSSGQLQSETAWVKEA